MKGTLEISWSATPAGSSSSLARHSGWSVRHVVDVLGLENQSDDRLLAERRSGLAGPAFEVFYRRHERALLAFFRRRVASAELAADLTAETFAQALQSRSRYRVRDGESSSVAWLYGIAGHVYSRSVRRGKVEDRARRKLGLPQLALEDDAIAAIEDAASGRSIADALARLSSEQREAVKARILEERSYSEIAVELDCSEAVVRKRVSRGLATLRSELEGLA